MTASPAEILVDLSAIRHNVSVLRALVAPAEVIVVVKADGYGHGMVPVARAAREAGAPWLAVATPREAVALREAGDTGPLLAWLSVPGEDVGPAVRLGVTLTAYDVAALDVLAALATPGHPVPVQLKIDTGLSRGGSSYDGWPGLVARTREHVDAGRVALTGVWSHLACADEPDHPANIAQATCFAEALEVVRAAGLDAGLRHLTNSPGALLLPDLRHDAVRTGLAVYGLDPAPGAHDWATLGLRPAMTVRSRLALVKDLPAGSGISYGHTEVLDAPTRVGLVPVGYGDGIPRHASGTAEVGVRGGRARILGRVCMDQFVVDLGATGGEAGDEVLLFGPGDHGEPTALEWAEACGTISYEIVTRVGGRFERVLA